MKPLEGVRKAGVKNIYWGESSFGAYVRGKQHLKALERPQKHQENAFVRHREDFHSGEEAAVKFKFEIVRCYSKCMGRLVGEGCHIQSPEADICMNGKLDHYRPGVGKVIITNMVQSGRRRNRNTG